MIKSILGDIDAAIARDPAARSRIEVGLLYPGIQAVFFYRVAHFLWINGWKLLGRFTSQFGRWITGIEIHPGAEIGERFFIDHGMGVVIGETSHIGDDVTLYHGVTLGGVAPSEDSHSQRNQKRHPTLEDGVIVGSGAQVLGPVTVGRSARVGANAVVTKDVAPGRTVIGVPAKSLERKTSNETLPLIEEEKKGSNSISMSNYTNEKCCFVPYGTPCGDIPDPAFREIIKMHEEMLLLRQRLSRLEEQLSLRSLQLSSTSSTNVGHGVNESYSVKKNE